MKTGWRWSPTDQPTGRQKELWQLLDAQGAVRAEVFKSMKVDDKGTSYVWVVWPFHVNGNIDSANTVVEARISAEKRISNQK